MRHLAICSAMLLAGVFSGYSADVVELPYSAAVVVGRLMDSEWHQRRPFNDFMPVDWSDMPMPDAKGRIPASVKNESKRGRTTCGCVADAMGQILRYFEWPVRMDKAVSFEHNWKNERGTNIVNGVTSYANPITGKVVQQFDGHVPFEYATMTNVWAAAYKDPRGTVPEINRYSAARLVQAVGILLEMDYRTGDSGSYPYTMTAKMTDWYETPTFKVCNGSFANGRSEIVAALKEGVPVTASLPGHQIVIHGYAKDGETEYVYVATDGSGTDGWCEANKLEINEATIGFKPKKTVQIEPLRAVEDSTVEIRWALPKIWKDKVAGFTCTATPEGGTAITKSAAAADRSCTFAGLAAGKKHSFVVTPAIDGAVTSAAVTTTIADGAKAAAWPAFIDVWGTATNKFGETWYHENAMGKGFVYVRCSPTVKTLEVISGNLTALPQDKIAVKGYGNGCFAVTFDGSNVAAMPCSHGTIGMNRQRMVATLKATDESGTSVYKNLSLRFSNETAAEEPAEHLDVGGPGGDDEPDEPDAPDAPVIPNGPTAVTNRVPVTVALNFTMTTDDNMKVAYVVRTNGVSRAWEGKSFVFVESGGGRNLWRGAGNQKIGGMKVRGFTSGGWAGYPVPNTNLEAGDAGDKYWQIDVPFDLQGDFAVTNWLPKVFITNFGGATDQQPTSNRKRYDVNVSYLSADRTELVSADEVRTDELGATRVNAQSATFAASLSNGYFRIRMDNSSMPGNGAFGGIQGLVFQGEIVTVTEGEDGGDEPGGDEPGPDEPPPLTVGTNVVVAPLCAAMWNQGRHYNLMCPTTDDGGCDGRMWAGCTAVATAILMKYYEWPKQGETWYQNLNDEKSWANNWNSISLRARFDEPYDWEAMQDVYGHVTPARASLAVGRLVSDIGAVMNMNYGKDGSSTLRDNVTGVLEHNFHFDASELYVVENFTPESEALIQAQLKAGHPIVSAGAAGASGTGHTYVCDGFEQVLNADGTTNTLYHFNFGWGGTSNGWYPLRAVFTAAKPGEAAVERPVETMMLGLWPKKSPQILEGPDVTGPTVGLEWAMATCWTNGLDKIVVEDQVKGSPVERQYELGGEDWFIYAPLESSSGWNKEDGAVVGRMGVFHSYYGDSYYWPGNGGGFFSDVPVTVSSDTDIEIVYMARKFPAGVRLEIVRCQWDEGLSTYIDHDGKYNFYEPFATLSGGASQDALSEVKVVIPGAAVAQGFGGGTDNAHFCLRFVDESASSPYGADTVVFQLKSFRVKGMAESWETVRSLDLVPTARACSFDGTSVGLHRFVVSARYDENTVYSSVVKTVRENAPVRPAVTLVSASGNTLTYAVNGTSDYSYEFVTQSNVLHGDAVKNGNAVTYTFAKDVATVGTHWITLYVTDNATGAKAKYVYVTNPPQDHPLCPYKEDSVAAAAQRGRKEGKPVFLLITGEPDNDKFVKLSGFLATNEIVNLVKDGYVFAELCGTAPTQSELAESYWRSQPVTLGNTRASFSPKTKGYAVLIDPRNEDVPIPCTPNAYGTALNSQYDIVYPTVEIITVPKLIAFLGQDFGLGLVPEVKPTAEPTIADGALVGTIAKTADGEYVVTLAENTLGVAIENAGTNMIAVPPKTQFVTGVPVGQIKVRHGAYDIGGAFALYDAGANGVWLTLDGGGSVMVDGEPVSVTPVMTAIKDDDIVAGTPFAVTSDKAALGVKAIPGLTYALLRAETPEAARTGTVVNAQVADGPRVRLVDSEKPTGRAFYVIRVTAGGEGKQ